MTRLRFRERVLDVNIDTARLAREHPRLEHVRKTLIDEGGERHLVDEYLTHRLELAFGKFGLDYLAGMSERIDHIFQLRDELAGGVQKALRGEKVHIDDLKKQFKNLTDELDAL